MTVTAVVGVVGVIAETPGSTTATGRAAESLTGKIPPGRLVSEVPIEESIGTI